MKLSVIVPAFNEERTICLLLERLMQVRQPDWQIIVVDDGSTDGTRGILQDAANRMKFEFILREQNGGKTAAVRSGLDAAVGNWVLFQDADLEYEPEDIVRLLAAAEDSASVVYGRRPSYWNKPSRWLFASGVLFIDIAFWIVYRRFVRDHATCYKLLPRQLMTSFNLQSTGFEGCVEITAKLMKSGIQIQQIPIEYHPRSSKEGKKLTAMHGPKALHTLWKWRRWKPGGKVDGRIVSHSLVGVRSESQRMSKAMTLPTVRK
ncbi:glycosyltransferase family 2 protein [Pirellulaceae bacterium SH449]